MWNIVVETTSSYKYDTNILKLLCHDIELNEWNDS